MTTKAKADKGAAPKAQGLARELTGFKRVGTVREDGRGRVSIGGSGRTHKPDGYQQFVNEHGEILLVPIKEIPERELWLWQNPAAMTSVQRGLAESAAGLATPFDMSKLTDDADNET